MIQRRELTEILFEIQSEMPYFSREKLLEYLKWAVPKLYDSLKNSQTSKIKCSLSLLDKINKEKNKYRIDSNIDFIKIHYAEIYNYIKDMNDNYIQVYLSVYFYDDVKNNTNLNYENDKYWNDIWIVTLKEDSINKKTNNSNCINCGAPMKYNQIRDVFECEYCRNIVYNTANANWEIIDIDVEI